MKRRSKTGASVKSRRRKAATPKRGDASKVTNRRGGAVAGEGTVVARLTHDRDDALLREAANSEILHLISRSPGDLELVFRTILEHAIRICNANFGTLFRFDGENFHAVAQFNTPEALLEAQRRRGPFRPTPDTAMDRVMRTKQVTHSADKAAEPVPGFFAEHGGARTQIVVPMLKDDALIGAIVIYRQEVRPFADKQIELLQNFAAQAVIAIENARLLSELRESLDRQIATANVLSIISSSPGQLEPVFQAILKNAIRICEAKFGHMVLAEGNLFRLAAEADTPAELVEHFKQRAAFEPTPGSHLDRVRQTKQVSHTADDATEAVQGRAARYGGARSIVAVPMLKDDGLIGVILIYRQEVRPFTDKQIELVKNFAAQAVIAIENARLLNELRASLERQTATSDVLRVISSSPGELKPVFDTILENATRICEAKFGVLCGYDGNQFKYAAVWNAPPAFLEFMRQRGPFAPRAGTPLDQILKTKNIVHRADASVEEVLTDTVRLAGAKSHLTVPMFKDEAVVGAIIIYRQEVRPFTEKQIELVKNFAAQAVIAIENARLLNELRESLERQTATSDVLRIISSSPGELKSVFDTILENATRICEATFGNLLLRENGAFRRAAQCNAPQELIDEFQRNPVFVPSPNNPLHRVLKARETVHTVDAQADSNLGLLADARTLLNVPMLSHDELVGAISIYRKEIRPFTEKQIALVQNFAAQAVIAIENARLLGELRESLQQQTATAEVLRVISSSPGDLAPVFETMLESATQLCEAKFGNLFLREGNGFRYVAMQGAPSDYTALGRPLVVLSEHHPQVPLAEAVRTKQPIHITDLSIERCYREKDPRIVALVEVAGARAILTVPLLKDEEVLGAIAIYRQEARPFTAAQIEVLQNFAAQAVIAIENARLLSELRERTAQLEARSQEIAKLNAQLEARVADQVGEIERMGRLRRFLPPQVADLIVASGSERQLESHRREITALFCDLRGFTGFSESSDPEDVMLLLRQYHEAIGKIIITYSGTLERYAGDGVMVVFNDPVPVDNPALQAVRMALDMRGALSALIEKWRRLGHELGFGIGIAHGYATLGTIGFEGRFDYAAIGTVSNVASRLCDEAKPGQILISPRVLMAVEDAVVVEPVGDFALKGISRPLAAYNVVGVK